MLNPNDVKQKTENTKPLFTCPNHKKNNSYLLFKEENIFPCTNKNCFCHGMFGWVARCEHCHAVVHNCLNGCEKGIVLPMIKTRSDHMKDIDKDELKSHYIVFHRTHPIFVYYYD